MNPPSYRPKSLKSAYSLSLETLLVGTLKTRFNSGFFLCLEVSTFCLPRFCRNLGNEPSAKFYPVTGKPISYRINCSFFLLYLNAISKFEGPI